MTLAYFLCATPRTGSSLLCGLLDSTGIAGHPQAYFREPDEATWAQRWGVTGSYAEFAAAARVAGSTGNGVFGAKLMWGAPLLDRLAAEWPGRTDRELLERAFGSPRFVFGYRNDVVAQAVSWVRAEQTNIWYVGGSGEIAGTAATGHEPRFDAAAIDEVVATIEEHNAAWRAWFASTGVTPYPVRYEDLAADPVAVTRGVLGFLGLDPADGAPIVARHRRQADELNDEWTTRYRTAASDQAVPAGQGSGHDLPDHQHGHELE